MKKFILDLKNHSLPEDTCLVGKIDGKILSECYNFKILEKEYDIIEINIPENLIVVNGSYFIGAFGDRLKELAPVAFLSKYKFVSKTNDFAVKRLNEYVTEKYMGQLFDLF